MVKSVIDCDYVKRHGLPRSSEHTQPPYCHNTLAISPSALFPCSHRAALYRDALEPHIIHATDEARRSTFGTVGSFVNAKNRSFCSRPGCDAQGAHIPLVAAVVDVALLVVLVAHGQQITGGLRRLCRPRPHLAS